MSFCSLLLTAGGLEKLKDKKSKTQQLSERLIDFLPLLLPLLHSLIYQAAWMRLRVQPSPSPCRGTFSADIGPGLLAAHAHTSQLCRRQLEEKEVRAWESRDIRAGLCVAVVLGMRPQQGSAVSSDNSSGHQ